MLSIHADARIQRRRAMWRVDAYREALHSTLNVAELDVHEVGEGEHYRGKAYQGTPSYYNIDNTKVQLIELDVADL